MTLVDSFGSGLYVTGSVLFFTQILDLQGNVVGIGLTAAAIAGLSLGPPAGRLSDRIGPKPVAVSAYAAQAGFFAAFPFVRSSAEFLVVVVGIAAAEGVARPARRASLSAFASGASRVAASAYNRAVMNVGFSAGALGAGAALAVGSVTAFSVLLWGNALSFAAAAVLFTRLPVPKPVGRVDREEGYLFSKHIVASAVCCGALYSSASLLDVALPLQVATKTTAPHAVIALLMLLNTGLAIALQVRTSSGSESVSGAARANLIAGFSLVGACALFALSGLGSPTVAVVFLVLAVIGLTGGELFSSAGQWGMSYALAPSGRQAEFLGGFTLISSGVGVAAPLLATQVVANDAWGWGIAGAVFLVAGMLSPVVARRGPSRELAASGA